MVKNLPTNAGDAGDVGLTPRSGRSPGGRHGKSLQYTCLENPMVRGAWWATVYGSSKELNTTACSLSTTTRDLIFRRFILLFIQLLALTVLYQQSEKSQHSEYMRSLGDGEETITESTATLEHEFFPCWAPLCYLFIVFFQNPQRKEVFFQEY